MAEIRVAIEIDASPAEVWHVVEPIERHVDWMADAESIEFTSEQTRGVGTEFVCATAVGPFRLDDRMVITEWVPAERMGVRHDGVVTGSGAFSLEAIDFDRRTRFVWTETLRFPWFLGGPIGERFGGSMIMRSIWVRNLRRLKRVVERREATS